MKTNAAFIYSCSSPMSSVKVYWMLKEESIEILIWIFIHTAYDDTKYFNLIEHVLQVPGK